MFKFALVSVFFVASMASASGYRCETENGYSVKIYNHAHGATRTPAIFVLASDEEGTLLTVKDRAISKKVLAKHIQYSVAGDGEVWSDWVIVQIQTKESEATRPGQKMKGTLIFSGPGSHRKSFPLSCVRYKKSA